MATYQHATVTSADSIRAIANGAGSHFFDAATMRFFNSRLLEGVYPAESNVGKWDARTGNVFYFVTSERYENLYSDPEPRHYTVRRMTLTAVRDDRPGVDIETVGDYHATAYQARKAAGEAARRHDERCANGRKCPSRDWHIRNDYAKKAALDVISETMEDIEAVKEYYGLR